MKKVNITGHRAFGGRYPENSLTGIQEALALDIDRIEIDVHQTKDEVVVLMHDNSINRTTTGNGRVKDYGYADLLKFKIRGTKEERIPTLEEVLKSIKGKTILLIEIKKGDAYYPNIEKHIIALIRQYKGENWCVIQSFNDEILKKTHALAPDLVLHKLLFTPYFFNAAHYPYITEFSINYYFLSKRFIRKIHTSNKKVNAWMVNQEGQMRTAIDMGVDGIITDYPDLLKAMLTNKGEI